MTLHRHWQADPELQADLERLVDQALAEDIGSGDITAQLIPARARARARIITREAGVLCGAPWAERVFARLDAGGHRRWLAAEGDDLHPDQVLCELEGDARALLTGERTALNLLQTLSGTATAARRYRDLAAGTGVTVLDTRKTIPGLRRAQKYAVRVGGCRNHRMGLHDAFLIKENHIAACGGIAAAVAAARRVAPGKPVEIEVEDLNELRQALAAGVERVMLDNFSHEDIRAAVALRAGQRTELEVSGNIEERALRDYAAAGVDFISSGALTKHLRALDLSFRLLAATDA
ncbi:MAG: carboxylating nicotinate-nucleotide diphosphorylase [Pseudomonadales bacterium]|nr:carboxylating nicotinate-nucleotide diphosphorylase [Pseudomonadales bacterium]